METEFTSEEVKAAIKKLQKKKMETPTNSNKNAGGDHVKAKQTKCGTENIAKEIATINDEIARTGMHPIKSIMGY